MRRRLRYAAAIARRIRGPYRSLGQLDARLHGVAGQLGDLAAGIESLGGRLEVLEQLEQAQQLQQLEPVLGAINARTEATHELLSGEMRAVVRALAWRETENRERLYALRAAPEYDAAWTEVRPLVERHDRHARSS